MQIRDHKTDTTHELESGDVKASFHGKSGMDLNVHGMNVKELETLAKRFNAVVEEYTSEGEIWLACHIKVADKGHLCLYSKHFNSLKSLEKERIY